MAQKKKSQRSGRFGFNYYWSTVRFLLPLIACVIVFEIGITGFLVSHLEDHQHRHSQHHWGGQLSYLRRKFLRMVDPRYRQKSKPDLLRQAAALQRVAPFHHPPNPQFLTAGGQSLLHAVNGTKDIDDDDGDNQPPLDNFYSRPHYLTSEQNSQAQAPFLIVGGSDGSGTRMFVQILMDLGVPMVVDSYDTMDINAEEMSFDQLGRRERMQFTSQKGWPPLVQLVLQATHKAANYTLQDLPGPQQQFVMAALLQLKSSLLAKGNQVKKDRDPLAIPLAAGVQVGFKAPVAMLLLPLLRQVFGSIRFLHIVRDGRDVALSDNVSPVSKFYNAFYGHEAQTKTELPRLKLASMRLWADWNKQVYQWEKEQVDKQRQGQDTNRKNNVIDNDKNNLPTLDYMVLRTEDFVHPETRLEALEQLAQFVGARVTPLDLCCLSRQRLHDMGQSNERRGGSRNMFVELLSEAKKKDNAKEELAVQARYGKWRQVLQDKPELLAELETIGKETLETFGYKPSRRFLDRSSRELNCDQITSNKHCPQRNYANLG